MQYTNMSWLQRRVVHALSESDEAGVGGFDAEYSELHRQANPGWLVHAAYSRNKFSNEFQRADARFYASRNNASWVEIFNDTIVGREKEIGEEPPCEGAVPVIYISGEGLP